MSNKMSIAFLTFSILSLSARADEVCPPPASAVSPQLQASVTYDKKTGLYTYKYKMTNKAGAPLALDFFGLFIKATPNSSTSPAHWNSRFLTLSTKPRSFTWSTSQVDPAIANVVTHDTSAPQSFYAIKPGASLGGFELKSDRPPSVVEFFAQGDDYKSPISDDDSDPPVCPGYDPDGIDQVSGVTTGPSDPAILPVKIRAREESGLRSCAPIEPQSPKGKIAVLVLSTRHFDASQINASSIVFGPGQAAPLSSKLIPTGRGDKDEAGDPAEWEQFRELYELEKDGKKDNRTQNLLLTFDVAALDVQCNIDQALFLKGKTSAGQDILGAVTAKVVGCDQRKPGVHKHQKHFSHPKALGQQKH